MAIKVLKLTAGQIAEHDLQHSDLSGITSGDDHSQYFLLAGRVGGQSAYGGTAASNNLTLYSTSNATKGKILIDAWAAFDEANQRFGVGTTSPSYKFQVGSPSATPPGTAPLALITGGSMVVQPNATNGSIGVSTTDWASGAGSVALLGIGAATGNTYSFVQGLINGISNTYYLCLNPFGGNVGIGITAPSERLDLGDQTLLTTQANITEVRLKNTGLEMKNIYTGGGWARGLLTYTDSTGSIYFGVGAYGNGQTFNYGYIGPAYNTSWISFNSSGVEIGRSTGIVIPLTVNGSVNISDIQSSGSSSTALTATYLRTGTSVAQTALRADVRVSGTNTYNSINRGIQALYVNSVVENAINSNGIFCINQMENTSGITVTNMTGILTYTGYGYVSTGNTCTSARGLWIKSWGNVTPATFTSQYGIYIENITGATNNYAIYALGGSSYHAGSFGIGTLPTAKLHVSGDAIITSNLTVNSNTLFVNASTNRVGINTGSPNYPLEVVGTIYVNSNAINGIHVYRNINSHNVIVVENPSTSNGATAGLRFGEDFATTFRAGALLYRGSGTTTSGLILPNQFEFQSWDGAVNGLLLTSNAGPIRFAPNKAEVMRLTPSFTVGIGTTSPNAKLDVVGTVRLGDSTTNYSSFESDGTYVAVGAATTWDDIIISAANLRPGLTPPGFDAFDTNIYQFSFDDSLTEELYGSFEIPHSYKEGTDLVFHIHWSQRVSGAGNVYWEVNYSVANSLAVFPAQTTANATTAASGTAKTHSRHNLVTISGTGRKIGDVILFRLARVGGNAADTLTGDAWVHSIGVHFEQDTLGSRQITAK